MAQGDSIGGSESSINLGPGSFEVIPTGQVWLITYLTDFYTGYGVGVPGIYIHGTYISTDLKNNVNIRFFASSMIIVFDEEIGDSTHYQAISWNGVQFK